MSKPAFSGQRSAIGQRVTSAFLTLVVCVVSLSAQSDQADPVSREVLLAAIDRLGDFEYEARMEAGRTVRRAPGALAVPALADAVAEHTDSYVRFRALVLLSGFNDPRGNEVILQQLSDRNDRLRAVAYSYFVHNPDEAEVAQLVAALSRETSAFVRPALIRALAAQGEDPTVRKTLLAELDRGENFFRGTVIEALGDYRARYASASLIRIAQEDGPLQVPAVLALGQIGDQQALETLAELQSRAPLSSQPTVAAAVCLLGVDCSTHLEYLTDTVRFATEQSGYQSLLRSAAFGLGALAAAGNADALTTLFDVGIPSSEPARAPIALAIGTSALRKPAFLLSVLERRQALESALLLLRDAFDMLDEDFEEERFFATARRTYWETAEGSRTRAMIEAVIQNLEF